MVNNKRKRISKALFGAVTFQILLPFIVLCAIFLTKVDRLHFVSAHKGNTELFSDIRIKTNDPQLIFHGGDEVSIAGKWYDIKSIRTEGEEYVISVAEDKNESALSSLVSEVSGKSEAASTTSSKMLPFFFLFFEDYQTWHPQTAFCFSTDHSARYSTFLLERPTQVFIPPPNA